MTKRKGGEFSKYIIPVVEILKSIGGSGTSSEVTDAVIEKLNISEEELSETLKNGSSKVKNQIAWARMYLVRYGLMDSSKRGVWALTEDGFSSNLKSGDEITIVTEIQKNKSKPDKSKSASDDVSDTEPHETELLALLKSLHPTGFERLCQRLLREAGFEQVIVTGKTADGGIDGHGILKVNPLVSFNVIFQCKRYKDSISSPQIRDFRGAMSGRADKGIFITTGRFTEEAKKEARRDGAQPIELVDGESLVNMFEQFELGLKPVITYEIDHKFFKEFAYKESQS
ncbi:MAG: restriction endonuclease [Alteromonadaceae bacterium TMED7]|nr:MAG: restriction endonuclease [Alteromonadaceae bacterium TMED7]|tara:strand:+ start:11591 stop:12445 length:855 start_codon:yes stop_codon:yes gene_type:complete